MRAFLVAFGLLGCCLAVARSEAYGNYGGGLSYDYSKYGYGQQSGLWKGYYGKGFSGYGKGHVNSETVVRVPYAVPYALPPQFPVGEGTEEGLFSDGGTFLILLLFLLPLLLNSNSG